MHNIISSFLTLRFEIFDTIQYSKYKQEKYIQIDYISQYLVVSLWKGNLHKNKNYVNNPQTFFQKYSNVIEILQFFDFGQQSFFQFYINLSLHILILISKLTTEEDFLRSGITNAMTSHFPSCTGFDSGYHGGCP